MLKKVAGVHLKMSWIYSELIQENQTILTTTAPNQIILG